MTVVLEADRIAPASPILDRVRPRLPEIAAAAEEGERERVVPSRIVTAVREAGVLRMCQPAEWGGEELGLTESSAVTEAIARADGSTCASGADVLVRGAVAPKGRATPVPGGFRISGRWTLASGAYVPDWMLAGFTVEGTPPMTSAGAGQLDHSAPLQRRWRDLRFVAQHVAANNGHVRRLGATPSGQPA